MVVNIFVHVSLCTYPSISPVCLLLQGLCHVLLFSYPDERGSEPWIWNFSGSRDLDSQHSQHRDKKVGLRIIVGIIDFS